MYVLFVCMKLLSHFICKNMYEGSMCSFTTKKKLMMKIFFRLRFWGDKILVIIFKTIKLYVLSMVNSSY